MKVKPALQKYIATHSVLLVSEMPPSYIYDLHMIYLCLLHTFTTVSYDSKIVWVGDYRVRVGHQ